MPRKSKKNIELNRGQVSGYFKVAHPLGEAVKLLLLYGSEYLAELRIEMGFQGLAGGKGGNSRRPICGEM